MRVYFDASVIIAALLSPTGGSTLLFTYLARGRFKGFSSQTVIQEILGIHVQEKINTSKKEIEQFIARSSLLIQEEITPEDKELLMILTA